MVSSLSVVPQQKALTISERLKKRLKMIQKGISKSTRASGKISRKRRK